MVPMDGEPNRDSEPTISQSRKKRGAGRGGRGHSIDRSEVQKFLIDWPSMGSGSSLRAQRDRDGGGTGLVEGRENWSGGTSSRRDGGTFPLLEAKSMDIGNVGFCDYSGTRT